MSWGEWVFLTSRATKDIKPSPMKKCDGMIGKSCWVVTSLICLCQWINATFKPRHQKSFPKRRLLIFFLHRPKDSEWFKARMYEVDVETIPKWNNLASQETLHDIFVLWGGFKVHKVVLHTTSNGVMPGNYFLSLQRPNCSCRIHQYISCLCITRVSIRTALYTDATIRSSSFDYTWW